jgi:cyclopropane-fatty-acyl-phospholipid synthase
MMFADGPQQVFQMQLTRQVDAAPIVRDYITDLQRAYRRPPMPA